MIPGSRKIRNIPLYVTAGWLFADLLLGIAMIFLIASPGAQPAPLPTPTATVQKPSPTPQPLIELHLQKIILTGVDTAGLVAGDSTAITAYQTSVLKALNNANIGQRCAGLVIPYVGNSGPDDYRNIGLKVIAALTALGAQPTGGGAFFKQARYHDTLVLLNSPNSEIHLEIYLYTSSIPCYPTQG